VAPVAPVAPIGPVAPVGPVAPDETMSSSTMTKDPFNGTINEKNTSALLIFTRDNVTGADDTSIIPIP
jgi:hypothetical protein